MSEQIVKDCSGDHYFPDPGTVDKAFCGLCGTEMEVKRDCEGPTSFVMAMGRSKRKYDSFYCPNREADWHYQVAALKEAVKKTPSARIQKIYEEEIAEVLQTRVPTKNVGKAWYLK